MRNAWIFRPKRQMREVYSSCCGADAVNRRETLMPALMLSHPAVAGRLLQL